MSDETEELAIVLWRAMRDDAGQAGRSNTAETWDTDPFRYAYRAMASAALNHMGKICYHGDACQCEPSNGGKT